MEHLRFARSAALAGYVCAAVAFTWPLALHLSTHVSGPLSGDTAIYIWNLWVFSHELLAGRFPMFASTVFSLTPPVDLSLHNYTVAYNLLALPLLFVWSATTVYNVLILAMLTINGFTGYLVVLRLTGRHGVSWLSGLVFGLSPFVIARTTGHLSLVAVAPLAVFWLCVDAWKRSGRLAPAVGAGATIAWALYSDPYYAVYCAMLGVLMLAPLAIRCARRTVPAPAWARHGLRVLLLATASVVLAIAVTGGWSLQVNGLRVDMRSLYTPVLLLTVLALVAWGSRYTWSATVAPERLGRASVAGAMAIGATACAVLSPWFFALVFRLADGGTISQPSFWRSGVAGVDVLGLLAPNPNHVLMRPLVEQWLTGRPGGFIENVGAVPLVALAVIAVAVWRYRVELPRWWVAATAGFAMLALGPFIHVAGVNTYVPGPWAVLRYVPMLGGARNPSRFAVVVSLGVAVLFGIALARLLDRAGARRGLVFGAVAAALVVELGPLPRPLYEARVPAVYDVIAQDPRPIGILHLPFGLRDGTRTIGEYDNARQFYQTHHEKKLIGGYLSRLTRNEIRRQRESRVLRALALLSENEPYQSPDPDVIRARGARFARRASLGYVVVDVARTSPELLEYASLSFGLEWIGASDGLDLYWVPPYDGPEGAQSLARWVAHARGVNRDEPPVSVLDAALPAR